MVDNIFDQGGGRAPDVGQLPPGSEGLDEPIMSFGGLPGEVPLTEAKIRSLQPGTPDHYGAVGDGVTDDGNAVRQCIANHDYVFFPKMYAIGKDPGQNHCIRTTRPKQTMFGLGPGTGLKVKNGCGSYNLVIIGGVFHQSQRFHDFEIDQNASANGGTGLLSGTAQFAIQPAGGNTTIRDMLFRWCGVNCIVINYPTDRGVRIHNNHFIWQRIAGEGNYDCTAVYVSGQDYHVTNNFFDGVAYNRMQWSCIEPHGPGGYIAGNVSEYAITLVGITSSAGAGSGTGITVVNNVARKSNTPFYIGAVDELVGCQIINNTAEITQVDWDQPTYGGVMSALGAAAYKKSRISGNNLHFQQELALRTNAVTEYGCMGIGALVVDCEIEDFSITDNSIYECPLQGIHVGDERGSVFTTYKNITIARNRLIRCGHYPAATLAFKSSIRLIGDFHRANIKDNEYIDDWSAGSKSTYTLHGFTGTYTACRNTRNELLTVSGTPAPLLAGSGWTTV